MSREPDILHDLYAVTGDLKRAAPESFLYDAANLAQELRACKPKVADELDRLGSEALDRLRQGHDEAQELMGALGLKRPAHELLLAMHWSYSRGFHQRAEAVWDPLADAELANQSAAALAQFADLLRDEAKLLEGTGLDLEFHPAVRLGALAVRLARLSRHAGAKSRELLVATGHETAGRPNLGPDPRAAQLKDIVQIAFLGRRPSELGTTDTYADTLVPDWTRNKQRSNNVSRNLKALNARSVAWYDQFKHERRAVWDQIDPKQSP